MAEWARVTNTTIKRYIKGEEDAVKRNRKLIAMLEKKGRIKYNISGDQLDWKVRYRRATMSVNNGEQNIEFSRINRFKTANLDFEGYTVADSMTKREKLKNRGNEAIIKYWGQQIPMLMEDLRDAFAEEIYVDSSASGNSSRMSGIETMMAVDGTITVTSGAQRTANAADTTGSPNDTYAGLVTNLGNYTGSWDTQSDINTTWPFGAGSSGYDFWSPVVVNFTSSAFTGTTWAANAVESTRFAIDAVNTRNIGSDGQVDMVLLDNGLYRQYKDALDTKERILVDSSLELRSLGFKDVIAQDGVEISAEFGVPGATGYGWNLNCMEFCSMQDKIFNPEGPDWDPASRSWRVVVDVLGQFKFKSPRNFFKLVSLA